MINEDENYRKIKALENKHKGERIFVIGTGPSLNKTSMHLIKNEVVFCVNSFLKGWEKFGILPNYYALSDFRAFKTYYVDVIKLKIPLFSFENKLKDWSADILNNVIVLKDTLPNKQVGMKTIEDFSKDLTVGSGGTGTVVIDIALQAAYYMGFKEVYLLGCDCDYTKEHHFHGEQMYDFDHLDLVMERFSDMVFPAYEISKQVFEEDDRKIINCTVGGKLEIFERARLEDII